MRHVKDDEIRPLPQSTIPLQSLSHHPASRRRDVDSDPIPAQVLGGDQCRTAPAEGVQHDALRVAADLDDPLEQRHGLLRRVAHRFLRLGIDGREVIPDALQGDSFRVVQVSLKSGCLALGGYGD